MVRPRVARAFVDLSVLWSCTGAVELAGLSTLAPTRDVGAPRNSSVGVKGHGTVSRPPVLLADKDPGHTPRHARYTLVTEAEKRLNGSLPNSSGSKKFAV